VLNLGRYRYNFNESVTGNVYVNVSGNIKVKTLDVKNFISNLFLLIGLSKMVYSSVIKIILQVGHGD
jgi:hypothetical protein